MVPGFEGREGGGKESGGVTQFNIGPKWGGGVTQRIGSKWAGQPSDTVDELIVVLHHHPLRDFVRRGCEDNSSEFPGGIRFLGNFEDCSYNFAVDTDDSEVIARLREAIAVSRALTGRLGSAPSFSKDPFRTVMRLRGGTECEHCKKSLGDNYERYVRGELW